MKEQIAKSVFWMVWSRGGVQVLSFIGTLLVARWLSPSDYGVIALVGIWTGTIAMVADMGLGWAIVQFPEVEEKELQGCFWLTLLMTSLAYLSLYAFAPAIAHWFDSPQLTAVLRVSGVTLLLFAFRLVPDAMLRKRLALDRIAQAEIMAAAASIPVMLVFAWIGAGVWALVFSSIVQAVIAALALIAFYPWWPRLQFSGRRLPAMLRFSASAIGANLGWSVYSQLDSLIVGKLTNEQTLGIYAMAKQLALMPVTKISVVVNQLAAPVMARIQDEQQRMRTAFLRLVRLVTCLTLPLCVGLALVAYDLIPVVLGDKWNQVAPLFQVFCLYALTHSVEVLLPPVLLARYRSGFLLKWTIALLVVMPGPFVAGALWQGALGAAIMLVLVYPIAMVWMASEALKELDLSAKELFRHLRPIAVPTGLMALSVWAVQWALPTVEFWQHLMRLVVAATVGVAVYGSAVSLMRRPLAKELWEVMGWVLRRKQTVGLSDLASSHGASAP
ncbi:MAG TPA: lipopolysaccharide biosynthesis protein [Nitrospiraceae bacterium]|nr:lipopolysaccharide biosynthesis protein [Nitrospiraceae bacterium]